MNTKHEYWRNQTLVNRVSTDEDIAREYYTLAMYLFKEYNERMECIQTPLLHIVSHCMELSIKSVLEYACRYQYIELDFSKVIHSHSINGLISHVIDVFDKISKEQSCSKEDLDLFTKTFPILFRELGVTLQTDVTSYRYVCKIDRSGNKIGKSTPFINDNDSPNIIVLSRVFSECYSALLYTSYILEYIFLNETIKNNLMKDV